ncbi:MAG: hypothetical protein IT429_13365, partial [Gemmataceae bacterium]|nr:hypothetical protein [Gemmataceae bacterium]
ADPTAIDAPTGAEMTSPASGSALTSSSATFQWAAGAGTQFGLWIGSTGPGSRDLAAVAPAATSYTATGLPADGRTLNVRLWSLVGTVWQSQDYTYTAFNPTPATMTSPVNGATLASSTVAFQWAAGAGTQFGLWIGSSGAGSSNLLTTGGTSTSYTASGLPTDGRVLYVRLWSLVGSAWQYRDYTYTAQTLVPAAMTSPLNGSALASATATFQWSAGSATQFGLWIGSTPGSRDIAATGGAAASYTAGGLPTDGRTLYVRLWSLVGGAWQFNDYVYTAQSLTPAVMSSPVNGSILASSSVTFQWTAGSASQFGLWIGSAGAGSRDLISTGGTATSFTATGLPTDGRTFSVRLWSLTGAAWQFRDYTYTAQTLIPAVMTSPLNGYILPSAVATFQWTNGSASQTGLWIGATGPGSRDIATYGGTGTSFTFAGLPVDTQLYVRLWSLVGPAWQYSDYTYRVQLAAAAMISPANGSPLITSAPVAFQWSAGAASQFGLWIGNTAGSNDLAAAALSTTSYTASGLPTDGRILYVRLWSLVGTAWQYNDYLYTAQSLSAAAMTSPVNGATLASSTVTFQWSAGAGTQFGLWIGSTGAGSSNLGTAAPATNSFTATGLPTDGRTLYVRLWSLVGGVWRYQDYTLHCAIAP